MARVAASNRRQIAFGVMQITGVHGYGTVRRLLERRRRVRALLMTGDYLSIVAASAVPVLNAKRVIVKILPIDLGPQAQDRPVAIFTLKHRTLSPVTELFIDCVRGVAKTMKAKRKA
jgi:hypothetical protein